ncbi:MAG: response regulator transcription factor [Marinifilaceae bacterium]
MSNKGFKAFPNFITHIAANEYDKITPYISLLEGVARISNQCFGLIDFYKGQVLYISNNPMFLHGLDNNTVKKLGSDFNKKYVTHRENQMTIEIIKAWFTFINEQTHELKKEFSLSYDYHLKDKLINISMSATELCPEGKPWLVISNAKISPNSTAGNATIYKSNSREKWRYCTEGKRWLSDEQIILSDIEQHVIRYSIQGKTELEISELIFRSIDGLKSIKRRMFRKMEVSNITEAVSFAITHGLI